MAPTLVILSDPICPWCYIGKRRLDQAGRERADPFRRIWRPFQLNPTMPPEGMDRRLYLERKFGGPEGAAQVYGAIAQTAAETGLDLNLNGIARTPSTLPAHRLLAFAEEKDAEALAQGAAPSAPTESRQDRVAEALFRLYFEENVDISDRSVLLQAAGEAGLDPAAAGARLDSVEGLEHVREHDAAARAAGVTGAPTFVLDGAQALPGALPKEAWLKIFAAVETARNAPSSA